MTLAMPPLRTGTAGGFSALELVVVMAVISLLSVSLLSTGASILEYGQRQESHLNLRLLRMAIERCITQEIATAFSSDPNSVAFSGVLLKGGKLSATDGSARGTALSANANGFQWNPNITQALQPCATSGVDQLTNDSFHRPVNVVISDDLVLELPEVRLNYRVIALISAGMNGRFESSFNSSSGILMVQGDDLAEVVSGQPAVRAAYDDAQKKSARVAAAYGAYFLTRYLSSASRAIEVDYFANSNRLGDWASPMWDGSVESAASQGLIASTLGHAVNADSPDLNLLAGLGLAPDDVTLMTRWKLQIDNSSDAVNNPDQTDPRRSLPPFTARVIAPLPSGQTLITTVIGAYG